MHCRARQSSPSISPLRRAGKCTGRRSRRGRASGRSPSYRRRSRGAGNGAGISRLRVQRVLIATQKPVFGVTNKQLPRGPHTLRCTESCIESPNCLPGAYRVSYVRSIGKSHAKSALLLSGRKGRTSETGELDLPRLLSARGNARASGTSGGDQELCTGVRVHWVWVAWTTGAAATAGWAACTAMY